MVFSRVSLLAFLGCLLLSSCQTPGTAIDALSAPQGSVQKRQIESRALKVSTDAALIQTIVATLQDFGFKIDESNAVVGLVSGSKSQSGGAFYGVKADVRVTITASKVQNGSSRVRANFQKIIPSHDPRLYRSEPISDANLYQKFFSSLEQSLFLIRNE